MTIKAAAQFCPAQEAASVAGVGEGDSAMAVSRLGAILLIVGCLAAVACAPATSSVGGRIFDDRIELDAAAAPANGWLNLANLGSRACRLMVLDTLDAADASVDPSALQVADGHVVVRTTDSSAPGIHAAEELYAEVGGQVLPLQDIQVRPAVVIEPGVTARVQLALSGTPRNGAVRILVCDNPGDYEAGRYAVLRYA